MPDLASLAPRLDPLIRRLATNHDGERLATVAALERTLATAKADFHDLAEVIGAGIKPRINREPPPRGRWRAPTPDAGTMLDELLGHPGGSGHGPARGGDRQACSKASRTKLARAVRETRQPAIRLAKASMTKAT